MSLKRIKHYINAIVWTLVGLYAVGVAMVNIPVVQQFMARQVAVAVAAKLGTSASVGRVDLGFFNRIIIDDVALQDQQGATFLKATRLSVKFDCLEALRGRITINSAQVFGMKARLYRTSADAPLNIQYAIDSLASKDTTSHHPLDLQISSLVIRHGDVTYNQLDAPHHKTLDLHHLHVSDISAHIILNALRDDSLNLNVKKVALREQSGLCVESFAFKAIAGSSSATLSDLQLRLPQSVVCLDRLHATYRLRGKRIDEESLHYTGQMSTSHICPRDLAFVLPALRQYVAPLIASVSFSGTASALCIHQLNAIIAHNSSATSLSAQADASLSVSGRVSQWTTVPRWNAVISRLTINHHVLGLLSARLPAFVERLGDVDFQGKASGVGRNVQANGELRSTLGDALLTFALHNGRFKGHVATDGLQMDQLFDDNRLGILVASLDAHGSLTERQYAVSGQVGRFDWNQYQYRNINLDISYNNSRTQGHISVDDPNLEAVVEGFFDQSQQKPQGNVKASVTRLCPTALHLASGSKATGVFGGQFKVEFSDASLASLAGTMTLSNFYAMKADGDYHLDNLQVRAGQSDGERFIAFDSDFGYGEIRGQFDYTSLRQNIENLVVTQLPSLQQFSNLRLRSVRPDKFTLQASVNRADWLRLLFGLPVEISQPVDLYADFDGRARFVDLHLSAPDIVCANQHLRQVSVNLTSPDNNLRADLRATRIGNAGVGTDLQVTALAENDALSTDVKIDNHARANRLKGNLFSTVHFAKNSQGVTEARFNMQRSKVTIGDTLLTVHPASIVYSKNRLQISDLAVSAGRQQVTVSGTAAKGSDDSISVDLKNVDVAYVLDLVNFHSVDFSGAASGKAYVTRLFDHPGGHADLYVNGFRFEDGRMGTLLAKVGWNQKNEQIDIDAEAVDTMGTSWNTDTRLTAIRGYVSPKRNYIDLGIQARNTRGEFVESFCSSFMGNTDISLCGDLRLWGDLKRINLTGDAVASGRMFVKPLNASYSLQQDTIHFLVDDIRFNADTLRDRSGNTAVVSGALHHTHLSHLTYDFDIHLNHLLGYDWDGSDGSAFYGTVYASGDVNIKGRPGTVDIDIDATPERGSQVVYNASNPDAIATRDFIHWASRDDAIADSLTASTAPADSNADDVDVPTDIRINFLINTTPEATLKVIMDNASGDYIALNGSGVIRASYYNKGKVDVFGNYLVDHGNYKLTIQNIIKRDFEFLQGGIIAFGGDPYMADLNLKAQYQVNSVSLSDLQLGSSFSGNNIRVNCLMNISGTPSAPKVDFDMDMPTVGNDAKQMIYSIINSEEEMNQQVLYLLAVGRFLSPGSNNAGGSGTGEKQTSLAMQSILSGQISQQINNVLGTVINDNNWNFGANISTGDEGWNNAEYEGLLSGRLLNNRLLINGQFGYRDNVNATTSFIGDFDIRYLISPNGNFSVRVYNQTNDRYFTRNSLNTQGIGFIVKRDFNGLRDLFGIRRKIKKVNDYSGSVKK